MEIAAGLIVAFIGLVFGCFIGASLLHTAAKWVLKEDIHFANAFVTVFIAHLINVAIGFLVRFFVNAATLSMDAVYAMAILILPVGFLIQSGIISSRLNTTFGKACLVSLAMIAVLLGVLIVVGGFIVVFNQVFS